MSTHTTVNIIKEGARYPAGTPIEDLPAVCRDNLDPSQVDGPLGESEPVKKLRRSKPPKPATVAESPAPVESTPPADPPVPGDPPVEDDDEPF